MKYLYLIIDLLVLAVPLLASFNKPSPFDQKWKYLGAGLLITTIIFIAWEEVFIQLGIRGFNSEYITGLQIGSLPVEEILFFICIPYASVYVYLTLNNRIEKDYLFPHQELISSALIIGLLISGMYNIDKLYTGTTFLFLALFLAFQMLKLRPRYMGRFYTAFAILIIPIALINAILTGSFTDEEIVWYNSAHTLGMHVGTIPLENFLYAMLLVLITIAIMEWSEEWVYYRKKK